MKDSVGPILEPPVAAGGPKDLSPPDKIRDHSFASLDVLRGLAAFTVLFQHTESTLGGYTFSLLPFSANFAVDVFMLISGFLMMWHYYERSALGEKWTDPRTVSKFYLRRFFRIAPLYYFLLLLTYPTHDLLAEVANQNVQTLHVVLPPVVDSPIDPRPTLESFLAHVTFLFGFIPRFAASTHLPDWSIGLEMQFYLFFPFLAIFLVRTRFIGAAIVFLALKALTFHLFGLGVYEHPKVLGLFPYPSLLTFKIDNFLVGMLLACGVYARRYSAVQLLVFGLAFVVAGLYMKKFLLVTAGFIAYEMVISTRVSNPALCHVISLAKKMVEARIFKFLADTSYGVYLIHPILINLIIFGLARFPLFLGLGKGRQLICTLLILVPTANLLAYVGFKLIESPGIGLGRTLVRRLGPAQKAGQ